MACDGAMQRGRVKCDPNIQVSDVMECFRKWFQMRNSRDLTSLFKELKGNTWKTAPVPKTLETVNDLFVLLVGVARNTALPRERTKVAIEGLHKESPINFTMEDLDNWSHKMGELTRIAMSKYRAMSDFPMVKERAFKKAPLAS